MEINKIRFFYFTCLIFLLYSIIMLNDEKYEVNYRLDNYTNIKFQYLECVYLIDLFENQSLINLNEINYDYFNKSITKRFKFVHSYDYFAPYSFKIILNTIKSKNYLIIDRRICIPKDENELYFNFNHFFKKVNYFIFNNESLLFWELENSNSKFELRTVLNLESPYNPGCYYKYNKVKCLNECAINKYRLSKYFYTSKDVGLIYLDYKLNNSILNNQRICSKKCKYHIGCQITTFNKRETRLMKKLIVAYPSIDTLDYYTQLFGLISLFLNISLNQFLIKLSMILRIIKNFKWIKLLIFIIVFILIIIIYFIIINNYLIKRDYPIEKEIYIHAYQFNELNIAICVSFNELLNEFRDYFFIRNDNRTLNQMEKLTEFNESYFEIYLKYQDRKLNINWRLEQRVIFYNHKRCYQITIPLMNLKNKNKIIISLFRLVIKIDYNDYDLFILSDNKLLQLNTYKYNKLFNFMKHTIIRSKVNQNNRCLNYRNLNLNCITQFECLNLCKINKLYSNFKKIDSQLVTYKDYFTEKQWNLTVNDYTYFKLTDIDDCLNKYLYKDCEYSYFDDHNQIKYSLYRLENKEIELNLYYDKIYTLTDEQSFLKLLLELLNIQIIIFGLNAFKLITIIFNYNRIKFKYNNLLIYLLCSIGFSYHLWFIFDQIINDDLIYIQYFELSDKFKMSDLIFCCDQLDELEIDNLFDRIKYLNKLGEWKLIDKKSNYSDNHFKIDNFKLNNYKKCFKIKIDLEYDLEQFEFEFSENKINLKIYFNSLKYVIFNVITKLDNDLSEPSFMAFQNSIFILTSELFELIYNDKFKFFKNPFTTIFNDNENLVDVSKHLNNIVNNLEKKLSNNLIDNEKIDNENIYQNQSNQLNRKLIFLTNHLDKRTNYKSQDSTIFKYNLNFVKRKILVTNEANAAKLILNLLNLINFWYNIGILDLAGSYFVKFYNFLSKIVFKIKFWLQLIVYSLINKITF